VRPCESWIEQCEATKQIEAEFGTRNALDCLIGEKFLNFLQAAETDAEFRATIPAFVGGNQGDLRALAVGRILGGGS
jgi:hypothetical protein